MYSKKRYTHPYVHSSTVYSSQDVDTAAVLSDRRTKTTPRPQHTHTMKHDLAIRKNEVMSLAVTRTDLEIIILSKARQKPHDTTYTWNIKHDTTEHFYKT